MRRLYGRVKAVNNNVFLITFSVSSASNYIGPTITVPFFLPEVIKIS